jgi:uracil-DNA glycosylase family 4
MDYHQLAAEIQKCRACVFNRDGNQEPIPPAEVNVPVKIMFVGENPSHARNLKVALAPNTPSGQALDEYYLKCLNLLREDVWITNLFKCRYPKGFSKKNEDDIQQVADQCARLWLLREIELVQPTILVTLSDKQVFQRLRLIFCEDFRAADAPSRFEDAVGRPHKVNLDKREITLFPMVHPHIVSPAKSEGEWKDEARKKWRSRHVSHIATLKEVLGLKG